MAKDYNLDPESTRPETTYPETTCMQTFASTQRTFLRSVQDNSRWIHFSIKLLLIAMLSAYLAMAINFSLDGSVPLLVMAGLSIVYIIVYMVCGLYGRSISEWFRSTLEQRLDRFWRIGRPIWYAMLAIGAAVFLGVDVGQNSPQNLVSLSGIAFFIVVSFIFSKAPAQVPWRTVFSGMVVQLVLGIVVLRWDAGKDAIEWIANQIVAFVNYGLVGAKFMFGETFEEHYFAMALLPILAWFSAISNVLLYLGVIQVFVTVLGGLLYFLMGTSPVEAFVAVSNIFLGPEPSMMMIKGMLNGMTLSQLHSLMACGLASIDAGLFGIFESFGVPARHLLSASCMSAPAALVLSKILYPETEKTSQKRVKLSRPKGANIFDVFVNGAQDSIMIMANIVVMLIAFISILAFVNTTVTWMGDRAGIDDLTLENILGYILMPVVFLMGVPWEDCALVGELMGTKTVVNEFVAYVDLGVLIENRKQGIEPSISERSEVIAAYALCGFSNLGTVGMLIGFLSSSIPDRKSEVSVLALRTLVAGSFACFMTACMAGLLVR